MPPVSSFLRISGSSFGPGPEPWAYCYVLWKAIFCFPLLFPRGLCLRLRFPLRPNSFNLAAETESRDMSLEKFAYKFVWALDGWSPQGTNLISDQVSLPIYFPL